MKRLLLATSIMSSFNFSVNAMVYVYNFTNNSKFVAVLTNQKGGQEFLHYDKILNPGDTFQHLSNAQSGTVSLEILNTEKFDQKKDRASWYGSTMVDTYMIKPGDHIIEGTKLHETGLIPANSTRQTDKN